MHFSIPDTQEFIDGAGNPYVGYNIHVNGLFHCILRYKQLHNLHEQLSKDLDISLPIFPPKKFFPLTISQQEERRVALEKYIQSIGQNVAINNLEILSGFLLNAQQETIGGPSENEILDIFLMNGLKVSLNVSTGEHSGQVLKKMCECVKLIEKYHSYFALFIITQEDNGGIKILRKLQNFESPFITYQNMRFMGAKVVLRKSYWDTTYDLELLDDAVALNLLYVQTIAEIHGGWIPVTKELQCRLERLQKSGREKEYLNVARTLKYYGYMQFAPCFCDYPQHGSRVLLAVGGNELNLRILSSEEEHIVVFKVSRMRCWRITTVQNEMKHCEDNNECILELSFEYLIARNELQWITIVSEQAILMSVCLQAMIDELLQKCVVGTKTQAVSGKTWTYIMRDGQSRITVGSPSREHISNDHSTKSGPIMKKLVDKWSAVKLKKSDDLTTLNRTQEMYSVDFDITENTVFRVIGDEDL